MPEMPVSSPSSPQSPGAPANPQAQPPSGSSPAVQPTQNRGNEVAAQKMAGLALLVLEQAGPIAGANTDIGKEIYSSIARLAKYVPPGTVTPQDIRQVAQQVLIKSQQFQQMQSARAQQAQPQQAAMMRPAA